MKDLAKALGVPTEINGTPVSAKTQALMVYNRMSVSNRLDVIKQVNMRGVSQKKAYSNVINFIAAGL